MRSYKVTFKHSKFSTQGELKGTTTTAANGSGEACEAVRSVLARAYPEHNPEDWQLSAVEALPFPSCLVR